MAPAKTGFQGISDSVWVAAGGVLGTLARYGIDQWIMPVHSPHPGFPWATFLINVSGAGLLGFILAWVEVSENPPSWLKPFAGIGFCGAFTTFSTASMEIFLLARDGHPNVALAYLVASLVCGLLAVTLTTALALKMIKNPDTSKTLPPLPILQEEID